MAWTERYVRADAAGGGDGTTDANSGANGAWTLDEAITNAAAGQRINVKVGTYTFSASKTLNTSGSASTAILWQGFNTTPGDLWNTWDSSLFPYFNATGGNFILSITGTDNWLANIKVVSGATTGNNSAIFVNGYRARILQCYSEATSNSTNARAISFLGSFGDGAIVAHCRLKSHPSAAAVAHLGTATPGIGLFGNVISGGNIGVITNLTSYISNNIIYGTTSHGVSVPSLGNFCINIQGNTFYSIGGNGVNIAESIQTGHCSVINNLFSTVTGYGIAFPASVSSGVIAFHNGFHQCALGNLQNIYQDFTYGDQTDATSPFINPGTDYGLTLSTEAFQTGSPGRFMDLSSTVGNPSIGAVCPYIPSIAEIQQAVWVDYPDRTTTS